MEIDLSDIPRATEFLRRSAGSSRRPAAPHASPAARKRSLPLRRCKARTGLPVKPDLPPEESFPVNARTAEPGGEPTAKPAPSPTTPRSAPGISGAPESAPSKSLRDLTPSLGKMVMAREEPSGGRGQGAAAGNAVGTGGKATGKEGVTEEGGGGFRLTPLNAPEIQFISYFASIKRKIELVWQYPYEARRPSIQGELTPIP